MLQREMLTVSSEVSGDSCNEGQGLLLRLFVYVGVAAGPFLSRHRHNDKNAFPHKCCQSLHHMASV